MKRIWPFVLLLFSVSQHGLAAEKIKIEVAEMESYIHVYPSTVIIRISAKIILPTGTHATISCTAYAGHDCWKIESYTPELMPPDSEQCDGDTCTTRNLGFFTATRQGNDLTV